MPIHDRAKARLEHEVVLLRREVATLRCMQSQNRKNRQNQAVVQARLEQEIQELDLNKNLCGRAEHWGGGLLTDRWDGSITLYGYPYSSCPPGPPPNPHMSPNPSP